ncbi:carbonic anhydrase family protein [Streptomyces sp. 8K308]|uniref:carbonic anhydrase family protein n=1 Tax=Streptomyces sp. 8K308 TaxID=2530388 RepID=UPI0014046CC0|nr:carbonic anhydrase family protein [Streptomyces sp. 8K308]
MSAIAGVATLTVVTAAFSPHGDDTDSRHGAASAASVNAGAHGEETEERETVHWSYHGHTGPEHWATLSKDFAACGAGREQSPIELPEDTRSVPRPMRPSPSTTNR